MKHLYEERIRALSSALSALYVDLDKDEVIQTMKNDKSTVVYLPAHLNEVIDRYLVHEREQFLHTCLTKTASLESQLSSCQEQSKKLIEELHEAKIKFAQQESHYKHVVQELKDAISLATSENDQFKKEVKKSISWSSLFSKALENWLLWKDLTNKNSIIGRNSKINSC